MIRFFFAFLGLRHDRAAECLSISLTLGRPRPQVRREDPVAREHLIEQRIQRERPCRTLFIRNVKASTAQAVPEINPLRYKRGAYNRYDSMRPAAILFEECLRSTVKSRHFSI
jgi:hypothetical protein